MRTFIVVLLEVVIVLCVLWLFYVDQARVGYLLNNEPVKALISYLLFLLIVDASTHTIQFFYAQRHDRKPGVRDNFHYGVRNLAKLLVGVGFVVTLFGLFGIDFKSLITSISIVAAAVAIISKDYINDYLVGIYFSFSRNFEINDYVKIGEHKGKIQGIEMLKIKLLNDDDDLVIIPNGKVYSNEIINYTKRDIRLMSVDFQLDIKSVQRIEALEQELIAALKGFTDFIEKHTYTLKIVDMKKDYIDFKFQYTLRHIDRELQREIRKKTVREIFNHISSKRQEEKQSGAVQPKD